MKLSVEISGALEEIVVSSLPWNFVQRIFRHCLGKNNTPYFANNCFKGVLYFDEQLAAKFAEQEGYKYETWSLEDKFYHTEGYALEEGFTVSVSHGDESKNIQAQKLPQDMNRIGLKHFLDKIDSEETVILMGSIDNAGVTYELEIEDRFDPDKLTLHVEDFEELRLSDPVLLDVSYDGKKMEKIKENRQGVKMIDPHLFSKGGEELSLYDFS
jgi:hypothetical protein